LPDEGSGADEGSAVEEDSTEDSVDTVEDADTVEPSFDDVTEDATHESPEDTRDSADEAGSPSVELEETGEPRVDAAVQELAALDELPTSEHADVYEDVHRRLHSALTELDTE
jgi:hypothetical protein